MMTYQEEINFIIYSCCYCIYILLIKGAKIVYYTEEHEHGLGTRLV